MGVICDGMIALQGKLNHLEFDKSSAKSIAGDGLRVQANVFFKEFYFYCYNISNQFCRSAELTKFRSRSFFLIQVQLYCFLK